MKKKTFKNDYSNIPVSGDDMIESMQMVLEKVGSIVGGSLFIWKAKKGM